MTVRITWLKGGSGGFKMIAYSIVQRVVHSSKGSTILRRSKFHEQKGEAV
jgi:hypothetical protein